MEPSYVDLKVADSGSQDTSPLGAAPADFEHVSVTREDLEQAGKPSTGQVQTVHRPLIRSQGKIMIWSDTPVSVDRP